MESKTNNKSKFGSMLIVSFIVICIALGIYMYNQNTIQLAPDALENVQDEIIIA